LGNEVFDLGNEVFDVRAKVTARHERNRLFQEVIAHFPV
jgi:hypothetical protein